MTKEEVLSALSGFAHIQAAIEVMWSDPVQLVEYINRLLNDTRENTRSGFPHPASTTLIELLNSLQKAEQLPEEDFIVHDPVKIPKWFK